MSLRQLIAGKRKNYGIATATVATNATHGQQESQNVANVAVVAVANPHDRQSALPANDHDHEQKPEPVLCIACTHYRFGHDHMGNVARCHAAGGFRGVLIERPEQRRECGDFIIYQDGIE